MNDDRPTVQYWRCPNCGQLHFGDLPPDMCAFCHDFTTWQRMTPAESPRQLRWLGEENRSDDPP